METLTDLSSILEIAVFGLLAVVGLVQARRNRSRAALWFGLMALSIFVVILNGFVRADVVDPQGAELWWQKVMISILTLFPYFLYRFMRSFATTRPFIESIAASFTVVIVAWTLLLPSFPPEDEPRPTWLTACLVLFVAHWTVLSLIVTVSFWRAGRRQASVARRRLRLLAVASILMTAAILAAAFASDSAAAEIATTLLAVTATVMFYLGYAPPVFLRLLWRNDEQRRLRRAISGLMTATTSDELTRTLLPHATAIVGGNGAAIIGSDCEVIGSYAMPDAMLERATVELHTLGTAGTEAGEPVRWADDEGTFNPELQGRLAPRDDSPDELELLWFRGGFGWLVVAVSPATPFFGREEIGLLGSIVALIDMTLERVNLFARERETNERLRQLDALKNEFVAMVAHDLRSPMTVIAGFADTMRQRWDYFNDEQKIELLGMISRNTKTLAVFVEDVLQVSRIESGEFKYDIRPFDPKAVAQRILAEMSTTHEGVDFVLTCSDNLPPALGDEERNWQILMNLLSNAVKFSHDPARVELAIEPLGNEVRVQVKDNGVGIAPEHLPKLFLKFSRIPPQMHEKPVKGTGLGLYICKSMVEAQGGRIWVDSSPGTGTTFTYTLPAYREVPA